MNNKVVVVGAGHAGGRCALLLRRKGFGGGITMIGEESSPPYERPPLSKGLLTGESAFDKCLLATREHYYDRDINLLLGECVVNIDPVENLVHAKSGTKYGYDKLVLATGGECRNLNCPGNTLRNIFVLRNVEHSRAIAEKLVTGMNVVIVGGGFIGLETAASAVRNGCIVTLIEGTDQLLGRVFPKSISDDITATHVSNGVDLILNDGVERFSGDEYVEAVCLTSGKRIAADVVIVGIGIVPRTELARNAGLEVDNGVIANSFCQTSDSSIYAIGDSARSFNQRYKQWIRLESWQNAEQQAEIVAGHIAGYRDEWNSVPWFWSDQFQYNIQMAGFFQKTENLVKRGEIIQGRVLYFGLSGSQIVGAVAIGEGTSAARDLRISQKLIEQNTTVSVEYLVDPTVKLKNLLNR